MAEASSEKVAVVTGAGSGLGRQVAYDLASERMRVVLVGRTRSALEETASWIAGNGHSLQAAVHPCDVTIEDNVRRLFGDLLGTYGRVDLLFNCAGVGSAAHPIHDFPLDAWSSVLATNLTGAFLCAREAFKLMMNQKPQGGRIINCGSVAAHSPRIGRSAYAVSKHGLTGLTRSISIEGRPYDISCGQVDFGNIETEMNNRTDPSDLGAESVGAIEGAIRVEEASRCVCDLFRYSRHITPLNLTILPNTMPFVGRG